MAGKTRFRVPTLEEMEKAEQEESSMTSRSLFKGVTASNSSDSSSVKSNVPAQLQSSPTKRMISQKALLSRQPLSSHFSGMKRKASPKKSSPSPADKVESKNKKTFSSEDLMVKQRVSRVIDDNTNNVKLKTTSSTVTADSNKGITSSWTGNVLGADNRNASTSHKQAYQPSTSTNAGTGKPGENNVNRVSAQSAEASNVEHLTEEQDAIRADVLPTLAKLGKTNSLVVSSRQRGNPILNFVRNVPWEYGNIVPDYVMGQCNCALYLSLRYHQLNPEYIHKRLKLLGRSFDLRVLLVQVDIKEPHHLLKDLAKICILADCTLMLAFSAEEAGRYLETYKVYENKAAEAIMEHTDSNFTAQLNDCLTRVKSVNKTDCSTLLTTFGNLKGIMGASTEDLSLCPGFGPQKAKRLHDVFREPFLVSKKQRTDTEK